MRNGKSDDLLLLAMYLLTSARGCLDEPKIYGVARLLEALGRVIDIQGTAREIQPDSFLESIRPRIDKLKLLIMESPQEVERQLDQAILDFTAELERRDP